MFTQNSGNLSTKSLSSVVNPTLLVQGSEYLESHLLAVPNVSKKDFLRDYESLVQFVVPRSAQEVSHDDEFTLYAVVTFKKYSAEFLQRCREHKWIPRPYRYIEGGMKEEQRQLDHVVQEEKKAWAEAMRMAVTGWSESVQIWLHVMSLRVFVEAVLRYGLPLDYITGMIKVRIQLA